MKNKVVWASVCAVLSVLFIVMIKTVDVAAIGPADTSVGLSHLNGAVQAATGTNMVFYNVTEITGYLTILLAGFFALFGCYQLIKRRSIKQVDKEIIALGGLYAVVIILYVFFEKVIINYRPVIMPDSDVPEASFPSSHTMLSCVIMGSAILLTHRYIKNKGLMITLDIISAMILVVTVVGRLLSGVHWTTDIIGGVLISVTLLLAYAGVLDGFMKKV